MAYLGAINYNFDSKGGDYDVELHNNLFVPIFTLAAAYINGDNIDSVACLISDADMFALKYLKVVAQDLGMSVTPLQLYGLLEEEAPVGFMQTTCDRLNSMRSFAMNKPEYNERYKDDEYVHTLRSFMRTPDCTMWIKTIKPHNKSVSECKSTLRGEFSYFTSASKDADGLYLPRLEDVNVQEIVARLDRSCISNYSEFVVDLVDLAMQYECDATVLRQVIETSLVQYAHYRKISFANGIGSFLREVTEHENEKRGQHYNQWSD